MIEKKITKFVLHDHYTAKMQKASNQIIKMKKNTVR